MHKQTKLFQFFIKAFAPAWWRDELPMLTHFVDSISELNFRNPCHPDWHPVPHTEAGLKQPIAKILKIKSLSTWISKDLASENSCIKYYRLQCKEHDDEVVYITIIQTMFFRTCSCATYSTVSRLPGLCVRLSRLRASWGSIICCYKSVQPASFPSLPSELFSPSSYPYYNIHSK